MRLRRGGPLPRKRPENPHTMGEEHRAPLFASMCRTEHPRRAQTQERTHTGTNETPLHGPPEGASISRQPSAGHSRPGGPPPPTRVGPGKAAGRPRGAGPRRRTPAPLRSCPRSPRAGGASARSTSHRFPVPEPGRIGRRWPRRRRGLQVSSACRAARGGAAGPPSGAPRCSRCSARTGPGRDGGAGPGIGGAAAPRGWRGRAAEQSRERGAGSGARPGVAQRRSRSVSPRAVGRRRWGGDGWYWMGQVGRTTVSPPVPSPYCNRVIPEHMAHNCVQTAFECPR